MSTCPSCTRVSRDVCHVQHLTALCTSQVIGGTQHLGETGLIMAIEGDEQGTLKEAKRKVITSDTIIHIFSDLSHNEIEVRSGDLQASDAAQPNKASAAPLR